MVFGKLESKTHPDAIIDEEVLNRIFADDRKTQRMLLQKFTSQTDDVFAEFETAFRQRALEQVRFHAHKLKSSARTVGANSLADLCFALETAAQNEEWEEIDGLATDLKPTVDRVKDYINGF